MVVNLLLGAPVADVDDEPWAAQVIAQHPVSLRRRRPVVDEVVEDVPLRPVDVALSDVSAPVQHRDGL